MYRGFSGYAVKSAGTEPGARVRVNEGHLGWADIIFVMEKKHAAYLRDRFAEAIAGKPVHCLYIPDDYEFMDEDLIAALKSSISQYVDTPE
jgi:predicted protein tyrosine phosphatase